MRKSTLQTDFLRQLLIGLEVKVVNSTNPRFRFVQGRVVDETRNMLAILGAHRVTKIPKETAVFRFKLQDGNEVEVHGKDIVGRPEDRLKKISRRPRNG